MKIFDRIADLQKFLNSCRKDNLKISLVPTMGGLHAGHISLIDRAQELSNIVVVSIFVNPTQFAETEDFESYPKTYSKDKVFLELKKVDVLFIPKSFEIYPEGFLTDYDSGELGRVLCGISRPSHFDGVAQVVNRLFNIINPDFSVFGEKDYQQLLIIKALIVNKDLDVIIEAVSTIREKDGLAMSTRNQYLSKNERANASLFYHQLVKAKNEILSGKTITTVRQQALSLLSEVFDIEYLEVLDANNLSQITPTSEEFIIISAVVLGETRLIDNILFRSLNV